MYQGRYRIIIDEIYDDELDQSHLLSLSQFNRSNKRSSASVKKNNANNALLILLACVIFITVVIAVLFACGVFTSHQENQQANANDNNTATNNNSSTTTINIPNTLPPGYLGDTGYQVSSSHSTTTTNPIPTEPTFNLDKTTVDVVNGTISISGITQDSAKYNALKTEYGDNNISYSNNIVTIKNLEIKQYSHDPSHLQYQISRNDNSTETSTITVNGNDIQFYSKQQSVLSGYSLNAIPVSTEYYTPEKAILSFSNNSISNLSANSTLFKSLQDSGLFDITKDQITDQYIATAHNGVSIVQNPSNSNEYYIMQNNTVSGAIQYSTSDRTYSFVANLYIDHNDPAITKSNQFTFVPVSNAADNHKYSVTVGMRSASENLLIGGSNGNATHALNIVVNNSFKDDLGKDVIVFTLNNTQYIGYRDNIMSYLNTQSIYDSYLHVSGYDAITADIRVSSFISPLDQNGVALHAITSNPDNPSISRTFDINDSKTAVNFIVTDVNNGNTQINSISIINTYQKNGYTGVEAKNKSYLSLALPSTTATNSNTPPASKKLTTLTSVNNAKQNSTTL